MSADTIVTVMRDAVLTVLKCSLPMLGAALLIGILVSIFQAATQINEQTLAFVPKVIGVFLMLLVCIGFIISETVGFFERMHAFLSQLLI